MLWAWIHTLPARPWLLLSSMLSVQNSAPGRWHEPSSIVSCHKTLLLGHPELSQLGWLQVLSPCCVLLKVMRLTCIYTMWRLLEGSTRLAFRSDVESQSQLWCCAGSWRLQRSWPG